jgi:hypothetical protein
VWVWVEYRADARRHEALNLRKCVGQWRRVEYGADARRLEALNLRKCVAAVYTPLEVSHHGQRSPSGFENPAKTHGHPDRIHGESKRIQRVKSGV